VGTGSFDSDLKRFARVPDWKGLLTGESTRARLCTGQS